MHHLVATVFAALSLAGIPAAGDVRAGDPPAAPVSDVVWTSHPSIQASLERLWAGSRSWRSTLQALAGTGRRALILTPDQVVVRDAAVGTEHQPFDRRVLAEVSPVVGPEGAVSVVLIVVNLPLLESAHDQRGSLPAELHDDLDRVLAHEVYGHALPYLLAGHVSGRCADPEPGQRALESCAIARENVVRAELGLSRRTDAGLNGLALAYRGRH